MIKVYSGEDTFESYYAAINEAKKLASQNSLVLKIVDADEIKSTDEFLNLIDRIDIFSEANLVLAKRLFKNKSLVELLEKKFNELNQNNIVIWEDAKVDGRLKLSKTIKAQKNFFDYSLPKEWEFKSWVKKEALETGLKLTDRQIQFIIQNIGVNKWIVISELKKLSIFFSQKEAKTVSDAELDLVLGFDIRGNMWDFLDYVGKKKTKEAIIEFERLTAYDDNSQLLIAMIARELQLLSSIKLLDENRISESDLKLHPFVLKKAKEKSSFFTFENVKKHLRDLLKLDLAIKRGELDERVGLILYLLNFRTK